MIARSHIRSAKLCDTLLWWKHHAQGHVRSVSSIQSRQIAEFKGVNFQTSFGECIQDISITWESWGDPTLGADRTVSLAGVAPLQPQENSLHTASCRRW